MNLVLRPGELREGLEVRADDNILPLIETRVAPRSGVPTLLIGSRRGMRFTTQNEIAVTIDLVVLCELTLQGDGCELAQTLKADRLKPGLSGSCRIRLREIDAGDIRAGISCSGNVEATGRARRPEVAIRGSGDVTHVGASTISEDTTGSANVKRR